VLGVLQANQTWYFAKISVPNTCRCRFLHVYSLHSSMASHVPTWGCSCCRSADSSTHSAVTILQPSCTAAAYAACCLCRSTAWLQSCKLTATAPPSATAVVSRHKSGGILSLGNEYDAPKGFKAARVSHYSMLIVVAALDATYCLLARVCKHVQWWCWHGRWCSKAAPHWSRLQVTQHTNSMQSLLLLIMYDELKKC
jgi:hypothetical protein